MARTKAQSRYVVRVTWLAALYAVLLIGVIYGFRYQLLSGPWAYPAAILPALPLIGIFGAIGRYLVEEQDEYVRMLMVRQSLWASGLVLSVATVWGFLEAFDLAPHIEAYWVATVWFAGHGLGACINKLTLGDAVRC